ncbi:hypothetical protein L9F63_019825, partial [Diploptera punctata]
QDGAEPSGNSVAASNLLRLSALLDRGELRDKAARMFTAFTTRLSRVPIALPELTSALMLYHDTPILVFVAGPPDATDTRELVSVINSRLIPGRILALADGRDDNVLYRRCEIIKRMKPVGGRATAYVCRHQTCSLPADNSADMKSYCDFKVIITVGWIKYRHDHLFPNKDTEIPTCANFATTCYSQNSRSTNNEDTMTIWKNELSGDFIYINS